LHNLILITFLLIKGEHIIKAIRQIIEKGILIIRESKDIIRDGRQNIKKGGQKIRKVGY